MPYRIEYVHPSFWRPHTNTPSGALLDPDANGPAWSARVYNSLDSIGTSRFGYYKFDLCRPIEAGIMPARLFLQVEDSPGQDIYTASPYWPTPVVNDRVRQIVESFEPRKHIFVPVQLVGKNGVESEDKYFFLINQSHRFSIDVDKSSAIELKKFDEYHSLSARLNIKEDVARKKKPLEPDHYLTLKPNIVHKGERIKGLHWWRELVPEGEEEIRDGYRLVFVDPNPWLSDELFETMMKAGVRGIAATNKSILG